MFQRDYIVRQVQQLSQAIAQAIFRIQKQNYEDAQETLRQTGQLFLGLDVSEVAALHMDEITLKAGAHLDLVAELFYHQGRCFEAQEQPALAHQSYALALNCYLNAPDQQPGTIDAVLEGLDVSQLSATTQRALFGYLESVQRFGAAEDLLFSMAEQGYPVYEDGLAFYDRLMRKSFKPLHEGNLPWDEVKEGSAAFRKRFGQGG